MEEQRQRVTIDSIDIGFIPLVGLMVKIVLASIPAALIVTAIIIAAMVLSAGMAGFFS